MPAVYVNANSPFGAYSVSFCDVSGATQHTACSSKRAAELLADMMQDVLDAEDAHCPCPMPERLWWIIRDALRDLAELVAAAQAEAEELRQLVLTTGRAWTAARVMGFACGNASATVPLLQALAAIRQRGEKIESIHSR